MLSDVTPVVTVFYISPELEEWSSSRQDEFLLLREFEDACSIFGGVGREKS